MTATPRVITKEEVGKLVSRLREYSKGWTVPRLAQEMTKQSDEVWTRSQVYHLERGHREITNPLIGLLAQVFDVPPTLFLYGGKIEAKTTTTINSRGTVLKLNRDIPGYHRPEPVPALAG